jgi:hypothetical protein
MQSVAQGIVANFDRARQAGDALVEIGHHVLKRFARQIAAQLPVDVFVHFIVTAVDPRHQELTQPAGERREQRRVTIRSGHPSRPNSR